MLEPTNEEVLSLRRQLNSADDKIKQLEEQVEGLIRMNRELQHSNDEYSWTESVRRGHK